MVDRRVAWTCFALAALLWPWQAGGLEWAPTFQATGSLGTVFAAASFETPAGPQICVGGDGWLGVGGSASSVSCWDGQVWTARGTLKGHVLAFAYYDDGTGPKLYAGGIFQITPKSFSGLVRWNGRGWDVVGNFGPYWVNALAVFDDGEGPALHVGGAFPSAGALPASNLAKWHGAWSAVGGGSDGPIFDLAVWDDGNGPGLYVGGAFGQVGNPGVAAANVARWSGDVWSALGPGTNDSVWAFAPGSDALYVGGSFGAAGGSPASKVAKWDGETWTALGGGRNGEVYALAVHDDGSGEKLFAGGRFGDGVAHWDGADWSTLGAGLNTTLDLPEVWAFASWGEFLFVGGSFELVEPIATFSLARWSAAGWSTLVHGHPLIGTVRALANLDLGTGNREIVAAGSLRYAGDQPVQEIARWNGARWSAFGNFDSAIYALTLYDAGNGPELYAGGEFQNADAGPTGRIARWNGTFWEPLQTGLSGLVRAMAVFEGELYVGGDFLMAGGAPAAYIARWDGDSWSALAAGGLNAPVYALTVWDDGNGPDLYVGGAFSGPASGPSLPLGRLARWDGASWSAVSAGSGFDNLVTALCPFDDGQGSKLYAGGHFVTVDGQTRRAVAQWDGTAWSRLSVGVVGLVHTLTVFDDGGGPALYAGGDFNRAGFVDTSGVAKWDGTSWHEVDGGMTGPITGVYALLPATVGEREGLWAGGDFSVAGAFISKSIAELAEPVHLAADGFESGDLSAWTTSSP